MIAAAVPRRPLIVLFLALAAGGTFPACDRANADARAEEREVVVFAAASLQDVFTKLAGSFRSEHPGAEVRLSFAGSQQLRTQIEHGASFDVFASADSVNALALSRANHLGPLTTFAENEPVIVVSKDAAGRVKALADLATTERLVIGTPEVPIGRYTAAILDRASADQDPDFRRKVEANVVSRELNVRQVLSKVVLGEAQAGIVYRSDALLQKDRVRLVEIPKELNVVASYPIAVAVRAPHPRLARAWLEFVSSPAGRSALSAGGFRVPEKGR